MNESIMCRLRLKSIIPCGLSLLDLNVSHPHTKTLKLLAQKRLRFLPYRGARTTRGITALATACQRWKMIAAIVRDVSPAQGGNKCCI